MCRSTETTCFLRVAFFYQCAAVEESRMRRADDALLELPDLGGWLDTVSAAHRLETRLRWPPRTKEGLNGAKEAIKHSLSRGEKPGRRLATFQTPASTHYSYWELEAFSLYITIYLL